MSVHRKRLGLYLPWAGFAVLAALWCGYWFWFKSQALHLAQTWAAGARASGASATVGPASARGFPFHLTLVFDELSYTAAGGAWRVGATQVPVSFNLTNPRHVIVDLDRGFSVAASESLQIEPRKGALSVRVENGALARASLVLEGLVVRSAEKSRSIGAFALHIRPDPRNDADLQIVSVTTDVGALQALRVAAFIPDAKTVKPNATMIPLRIETLDMAAAGKSARGDGVVALGVDGSITGRLAIETEAARTFAEVFAPNAAPLLIDGPSTALTFEKADGGWRVTSP
jgi:hypothetical protein